MTIIADDTELAAYLAKGAGALVLEMRETSGLVAKELGNAGDRTANQFLIRTLAEQRPDDGLLSEESKDTDARLSKSRVWIIDPVDGTREYSEGRSDWAVHVALAIDGAPVIGAVALPALDLVLRTDQPAIIPPAPDKLRMVVRSGGKSLHAWMDVHGMNAEELESLFRSLAPLGVDPRGRLPEQQFRLPNGYRREKQARQSVIYWNPQP